MKTKEKKPKTDLTQKKFGKLTALNYVGKSCWLCICECGKESKPTTTNLIKGVTKSCGCNREVSKEHTKERLLNSIEIDEQSNCWNWTKAKHRQGYGHTAYKSKYILAHRLSWIIFIGDIPENNNICHKCDNPSCINPDHLFIGTQTDNVKDCKNKNRAHKSHGEKHLWTKLTKSQVDEIRSEDSKKYTRYELAEKYNISYSGIVCILKNRCWKQ